MKEIIKKYIKAIIIISVLLLICDFLSALPPYIIKKVVDIDFGRDDIINTVKLFHLQGDSRYDCQLCFPSCPL